MPCVPVGGLQRRSQENEITHLPSDPAQSPCTVFMLEIIAKTDIPECRSHGFSSALPLLSLTDTCLHQGKADVGSGALDATPQVSV